ncbi:Udp-glycosyltransferase 73b3 [Thalictrum thalictroides]|uniref:Udp-glycosyltransferase 73b3 n=1 Tax=Thalictrum thalictroides TaxID=46969 RepID=A0A7J6X2B3_THATH|nr:Udp-glycosyltransferase 73b3 [Thalictrum thalictroides]
MGHEARQLHLFFFPLMAQGHTIPMIDIARLFAARGTKSTIITTPLNAMHIAESIDEDKKSGLDIHVKIISFPAVEAGLPEGCESFNSITSPEMSLKFFKAADMLQQPFDKLLEEHRPDCVVADMFLPWTTDVAKKYGIPRLVFHGTGYFSLCVLERMFQYAPQDKVMSDSEIFVVPGLPDKIEMKKLQLPNHDELNKKNAFTERRVKIQETEVNSFGVLVNSFYELESAYAECYTKDLGRRAWSIGPVSLCNRNFIRKAQRGMNASIDDEHYCLSWLDSKEPKSVLYVCFGSLSRFRTAQLHEIAMGLEASNIPFIWVVKMPLNKEKVQDQILPDGFEQRMQGNEVWNLWIEPENVSVTKDRIEEVVTELMGNGEEARNRRKRAEEFAGMAKKAVEKGGSSYNNLSALIEELRVHSQMKE